MIRGAFVFRKKGPLSINAVFDSFLSEKWHLYWGVPFFAKSVVHFRDKRHKMRTALQTLCLARLFACVQRNAFVFKWTRTCSNERVCIQTNAFAFKRTRLRSNERDCIQTNAIVFKRTRLHSNERVCVQTNAFAFKRTRLRSNERGHVQMNRDCVQTKTFVFF